MLWGSEPLLFPHHPQRPSCCLAIGKLWHEKIAVKLCPSRDCSSCPCPAPKTSPWQPASLCGPARTRISPHLALQPSAAPSWATCIRIRPPGEAAPLHRRSLAAQPQWDRHLREHPSAWEGCPASLLCIWGWPCPTLLHPLRPQRSVPREAGTPRPSEGSGPQHIQSRTAALRCLNWRCRRWCLHALLQCLTWGLEDMPGSGGAACLPDHHCSLSLGTQQQCLRHGFDSCGVGCVPRTLLKPCPRRRSYFRHSPSSSCPHKVGSGGPCDPTGCSCLHTTADVLEVLAGVGSAAGTGAALCCSKGGVSLAGAGRSQEKAALCPPQAGPPLTPWASPLIRGMHCEWDRWAGKRLSCTNAFYRPIEPTCWETNSPVYSPEQQSTLPRRQPGPTGGGGGCCGAQGSLPQCTRPVAPYHHPGGGLRQSWSSPAVSTRLASTAEPRRGSCTLHPLSPAPGTTALPLGSHCSQQARGGCTHPPAPTSAVLGGSART